MSVEAIPIVPSAGAFTDAEVLARAREITGNKVTRDAAERHATDGAILNAIQTHIRDLNLKYGNTTGKKEITFTTVAGTQDYDIPTYVGADVGQIDEVLQAGAYVADVLFSDGDEVDPTTGYANRSRARIPAGLQQDVFDTVGGILRARRNSDFSHKVVGQKLRLFPPPQSAYKVVVTYATSGYSIDTLPIEAREAVVYAACYAIIDAMLNKIMSSIYAAQQDSQTGATVSDQRIKVLRDQRDRYEAKYNEEFRRLRGN